MSGWISVDERLPEDGVNVLVVVNRQTPHVDIDCVDRFCNEVWQAHFDKYITHWMPLPEPPK